MILFAILVSLGVLLLIFAPLWLGSGGRLQAAASVNSIARLEAIKQAILKRYLEDERAFQEKRISTLAWDQRRQYLCNRYIDAARRLDFLTSLSRERAEAQASEKGSSHV